MHFRLFVCLVALLLPTVPGRAQLKWDNPAQQFQRTPADEGIEAFYTFRNVGKLPVTITGLRASCGCTTPHLEKKTYAPGETGTVTARFVFGDRKGPQHKTIEVSTDEEGAPPVVLDLRVLIHDPLSIEPTLVYWKRGEPGEAKTMQLTAEAGQPVRIKNVISSNPRLPAKLVTVKAGESYVVSVKPADTAQKEVGEIFVLTDFPADAPRTYILQARVK
ncbi:MAG: DUF1573 domain-containing protein [Chthoniobacter sp.]|nr:DUF1573 domain-containing protein [Chthoniobacter sp.]